MLEDIKHEQAKYSLDSINLWVIICAIGIFGILILGIATLIHFW